MPPRLAKRGSASAGPKRTLRSNRGASKSDNPPPESVVEADAPVSETREEEVPEEIVDDKADEKLFVDEKVVADEKETDVKENDGLDLNSVEKENEVKESIQEYEKDEQLELDDNELEYDPEE
ncbi:hypothetical protein F3Y22_tig00116951pilonHSYRG00704 [Hibiscus syriacus]|uniref:Uncharacterized protein n=1 Tax=Hibiscus syriacus TaxID=106335 RepID=A0A6A2WYJ6_HIBSY|nr:uncharacterized protein LOC120188638 [Hibiscus syriacus]XP_039047980.1 uncharacterized protein LOC120188638 [Hibiscus syriacus]KAE8660720.1 hypothetical protein F3Y22_tig00116951pilonHSYRG00704 [Hibiscus syriacus]